MEARTFLRRDTLSLFGDNDPQFLPRLKEKEKAIMAEEEVVEEIMAEATMAEAEAGERVEFHRSSSVSK
jgi:hypothetical protein